MRELTVHRDHPNMQGLRIVVTDAPGPGGANHRYVIDGYDLTSNRSKIAGVLNSTTIVFQQGAIKEAGINGLTNEALLAILADRLECFERGPYACDENAAALTGVRNALDALMARTERRTREGVEGTMGLDTSAYGDRQPKSVNPVTNRSVVSDKPVTDWSDEIRGGDPNATHERNKSIKESNEQRRAEQFQGDTNLRNSPPRNPDPTDRSFTDKIVGDNETGGNGGSGVASQPKLASETAKGYDPAPARKAPDAD